jgi:hypothetical protein
MEAIAHTSPTFSSQCVIWLGVGTNNAAATITWTLYILAQTKLPNY